MRDLFDHEDHLGGEIETLAEGAMVLRGFAVSQVALIVDQLEAIKSTAPFRHMITPGGHTMSAAMTNCGNVGWVTDRKGYRYDSLNPETGTHWPEMPKF